MQVGAGPGKGFSLAVSLDILEFQNRINVVYVISPVQIEA